MKTTIDMAREAGMAFADLFGGQRIIESWLPDLQRFEALVREDEREQGQKWFDAVTAQHKQLILAEREACAKTKVGKPRGLKPVGRGTLLDEQQFCFDKGWCEGVASVRAAIRARGETK
jgi:hypothetical protein